MRHTKIALPEPDVNLLNDRVPMWLLGDAEIEAIGGGVCLTINDCHGSNLELTPDEARAFGAALIAASYEAEESL